MRMRSAPLRVARIAPGVPLAAAALSALPAAAHTPGPGAPLSSIRVTGDARIAARPDRVQIDIGVLTQARLSHDAATANARARCRARCDPRRRRPDGKVLRVLNVEESSPRIVPLRARVACG